MIREENIQEQEDDSDDDSDDSDDESSDDDSDESSSWFNYRKSLPGFVVQLHEEKEAFLLVTHSYFNSSN